MAEKQFRVIRTVISTRTSVRVTDDKGFSKTIQVEKLVILDDGRMAGQKVNESMKVIKEAWFNLLDRPWKPDGKKHVSFENGYYLTW